MHQPSVTPCRTASMRVYSGARQVGTTVNIYSVVMLNQRVRRVDWLCRQLLRTIDRSRRTGAGGGCRQCQLMPARPSGASPTPLTPSHLSSLRSQSNRPWGRAHGETPAVTSPTSCPRHACETARAALRRCAGVTACHGPASPMRTAQDGPAGRCRGRGKPPPVGIVGDSEGRGAVRVDRRVKVLARPRRLSESHGLAPCWTRTDTSALGLAKLCVWRTGRPSKARGPESTVTLQWMYSESVTRSSSQLEL